MKSSTTFKIVQELVSGGEAVPDKYLHKDGAVGGGNHVPLVDIPVIDLILLLSYSPSAVDELDKLRSALASWGCFQAVNHGMSGSFLDRVREITRGYFDLPAEEKLGYPRADDAWTLPDTLKIGGSRISGPRNQNPSVKRVLEIREVLHEYSTKLSVVLEIMLRAKAFSIKLEEGSFVDQFGELKTMFARFNYYPQCPRPDAVLGLKPHSDGSALTIVLPNKEVEGLRFLREDKWVGIRIIPEALVINVGDQAEVIDRGILRPLVGEGDWTYQRADQCGHAEAVLEYQELSRDILPVLPVGKRPIEPVNI